MIILIVGLPGVGKTTLSKKLLTLMDCDYLNKDDIRDSIFPERVLDYSDEQNELAAVVMKKVAGYIIKKNPKRMLIIDGRPFRKKEQIDDYIKITNELCSSLSIIHCTAPNHIIKERLRDDPGPLKAGRTWKKNEKIIQSFEPILYPHLKLNMTHSLDELAYQCIRYIGSRE